MNTPAHLILGLAAFSKVGKPRVTGAAAAGALLPDLSLYVLAGTSLFILQIPPQTVFGELYFSQAWQTVFAIDNSFVIWGLLLALALAVKSSWAVALCGAALLHLALDFPLHHDDGRAHFWPLSNWKFESPFSYWDSAHHAGWIAPLEGLLVMAAAAVLARRHRGWKMRGLTALLVALELYTIRNWLLFF
ncbi:MAG: cobalamin biosynthesis protein CobQ [Pseudomonadota bacterium]